MSDNTYISNERDELVKPFGGLYSNKMIKFIEESRSILLATIAYSIFYSICMYKNMFGVTAPFWSLGTSFYLYVCMERLGFFKDQIGQRKKRSFFVYSGIMVLLGINLFMTMDPVLIVLDHLGIMLIIVASILHVGLDDSNWGFGKYLIQIIANGFMATFFHGFLAISDIRDTEYFGFKKEQSKNAKTLVYILVGVLVTIPIGIVVITLLASADKFFGEFVDRILNLEVFNIGNIIGCGFVMLFWFLTMYGLLRGVSASNDTKEKPKHKFNSIVGITINSIIGCVYFIFSFMQIYYLFLGNMTLGDGYTYAEYAREGFFQLVFVCAINMSLVLTCLSIFENTKALKAVLVFISACTYIMIASSVLRMYMYVSEYNFTYTRVFVFLALFIIFMIMNGVVIFIFNERFTLFKYSMLVVAICYILFAYSRPTYLIAKVNLSSAYDTERVDISYVTHNLGPDAAPAIIEAMNDRRFKNEERLVYFFRFNAGCDAGIRHFNLSGYNFNKIYDEYNIAEKLM